MVRRKAQSSGSTSHAPLFTRNRNPGQTQDVYDEVFRNHPHLRCDEFEEFLVADRSTPAIFADTQATTGAATGFIVVPRSGVLLAADFCAEDALATDNTNYVTFTLVNRVAGSGSVAMLAATDANTTKTTGGSAIAAKTNRSLTLNGTAANLVVNAGDVIEFTSTATGTLANAVDDMTVTLRIATIPDRFIPRISKVAGVPKVAIGGSINGDVALTLEATSEAQVAGMDWGDAVLIEADKAPFFQARVKISGVAANVRYVVGLASAFNSTFDSATLNAWFRVDGNDLSLFCETDDNTTDNDDQDTGIDLVADTYVVLSIDARDPGTIRFYVDGTLVKTLAAGALSTSGLQPVLYNQKGSGTTTGALTVDYVRVSWDRV